MFAPSSIRKQREAPLQDAILEHIRDYKVANDGNSPTYAEIAAALDKRPARIYEKVQRLISRGLLQIDRRNGKIVLGGQYIPPE